MPADFERIKDDIYTTEHIHVLQAVLGDEIEVETVHGKAKLIIPAGTESESILKLRDLGVPKVGSTAKGDHIVKIRIDIPKKLSASEKKLYSELAKEAKLNVKPQQKGIFG